MLRGHDADDDLRTVKRAVQIAGRCNRFRQDEPGQEAFIDSVSCDALGNFRFVGPEPDLVPNIVSPATSYDYCQHRAPRACAYDGNAAHLRVAPNVPDLLPNFD